MFYFANPCSPDVTALMRAGHLGFIDTPGQQNIRPAGVIWCADNGAFSDRFDVDKWWRFLTKHAADADTCVFAVAPDVVGDAQATLDRSAPWFARIRGLGYPVAFVAQDGLEDLPAPWDDFDCLFIGGTDTFKLGAHARRIAGEAKRRGKWLHMGRVNSERRFVYAAAIGCDSADGTFLTFGPDTNLPKVLTWFRTRDQLALF